MKRSAPRRPRPINIGPMPLPRRRKTSQPRKSPVHLAGGPLKGHILWLASPNTLPFIYRGQAGCYTAGQWTPATDSSTLERSA